MKSHSIILWHVQTAPAAIVSAVVSTGFISGAITGFSSGAVGGLLLGGGNSFATNGNFSSFFSDAFIGMAIGGITGALIGGVTSGLLAKSQGLDFMNGKPTATTIPEYIKY